MRIAGDDNDNRTIFCGNLSEAVTDSILFELFNQAGPVECVRRPKDQNGRPKSFAFVIYKHECSVPYALQLFHGTKLFNRQMNLNSRSTLFHTPVLDTHLTEFTEYGVHQDNDTRNYRENSDTRNYRENSDTRNYRENSARSDWDKGRNQRSEKSRSSHHHHRHSNSERDQKTEPEPTSWAELNALRGKGTPTNQHFRDDLQESSERKRGSHLNNTPTVMPDVNALLQMGQQMMLPGMMGMMSFPSMGLGPGLGNMFPSMDGRMSGGERHMSDRDRGGGGYDGSRGSRRSHPYNDRQHNDHHDNDRRHNRDYSSSRSSYDRDRRDRRNR